MVFYVSVGKRGLILRLGLALTQWVGAGVYWLASRRRLHALGPAAVIVEQ